MDELTGQNVVVTGGSRGLGRALGAALARAGARVVLVAREPGPLAAAVAEIRAAGGEAHAIVADVADSDATHAIAGQAAALVGPIDILINNASTLGPVPLRLLLDTDCEDLERALAVNLVGPFRLTKALAGPMVLRGRGTIVNISSDAAIEAYDAGAPTARRRRRWITWGGSGRPSSAGTGVRVLTVDPGEMDTRMHADAMPDADPTPRWPIPARVAARIVAHAGGATARRWAVRAHRDPRRPQQRRR